MGDEVDRQLQQYLLDRRRFLALGGGAALAGLLAACRLSSRSRSPPRTAGPTPPPDPGHARRLPRSQPSAATSTSTSGRATTSPTRASRSGSIPRTSPSTRSTSP